MTWTLCFLCLPCLPLPSNAVNMKAWACKASPQYSVKFGDNFVEIWYFTGQKVLFWSGSIKCFLCLPCLPLPSKMKAWACKASPQYSVKFGDNFVEIWTLRGSYSESIKRPDLQTAYRSLNHRVDYNVIGPSAVTRSDLMRVSHNWTPKLNILEILTHFWPASEPVDRQPLMIWTLCFLCLPCPPFPSTAVNMKAWACTAYPQYSVKFGDNFVEIW